MSSEVRNCLKSAECLFSEKKIFFCIPSLFFTRNPFSVSSDVSSDVLGMLKPLAFCILLIVLHPWLTALSISISLLLISYITDLHDNPAMI